jgi:hypothetical protein
MDSTADDHVRLARQAITTAFWESPLFHRVQSAALYHYAAALEGKVVHGVMTPKLADANLGLFVAHRLAAESSSKILPAIFSRCREEELPLGFSVDDYREAETLVDLAADWDAIDYSFDLVAKGQYTLAVSPQECRLTFAYSSSSADEADTAFRPRELEAIVSGERGRPDHDALTTLSNQLCEELRRTLRISGVEQCSYR